MTFIAKRALPRRTFLRGMGAAVALPMLDAMAPALSAATVAQPRLGFVYVSNGVIQEQWNPATTGKAFEFTPILKPLEPLREHINILSGMAHLQADTFGDGTGDHPRASAVWLTGVHAWDRTRPGVEVRLAVTADQIAAREIGKDTRLASLEMNVDNPTQGACDSGDCFYVNTVSWRNETTPNLWPNPTRGWSSNGCSATTCPGVASHLVDGRYDPHGGGEGLWARLAECVPRSPPRSPMAPVSSSCPIV